VPEELNEKFEELFRESDIVVIEFHVSLGERLEKVKNSINELSLGELKIDYFFPFREATPYASRLFSFIENSKKQIELENSPINAEYYSKINKLEKRTIEKFSNGNLREASKLFLESSRAIAKVCEERDKSFARQLIELYEENPRKEILVPIGAAHQVHEELKKEGMENVKQFFPYLPYTFSLHEEVSLRIRFKLPITEMMALRSIPELFYFDFFSALGFPYQKCTRLARNIVESLSYKDIESLSKDIRKYRKKGAPPAIAVAWLCKEKGVDYVKEIEKRFLEVPLF
jgi:hypothetical protein